MKAKTAVFFLFIIFNGQAVFGQYYFEDVPITKNVIEVTHIKSKKSFFQPKEKSILKYKEGKLLSVKNYKGKKLVKEETYEYKSVDNKEVVERIKKNKEQGLTFVNYFDKEKRLNKSETYLTSDLESPTLIHSDFRYNEMGKMTFCKSTSIQSNSQELVSEHSIEYVNKYLRKKRITSSSLENTFTESILEYDPTFSSAINTNCIYYTINGAEKRSKELKDKLTFYLRKSEWFEEGIVEINGKKKSAYKILTKLRYTIDDQGNFIELYQINKKGKKKLIAKRIIQYKEGA